MSTTTDHGLSARLTLAMSGQELREFLGAVLPHAGTDEALPELTWVTLDFDATAGTLVAVATDRFTFGAVRYELDECDTVTGALTIAVSAAALRVLTCQITPRARVRLTLTAEQVRAEQLSEPTLTCHLPIAGQPPRTWREWRSWLAACAWSKPRADLACGVALNVAYLSRFRSAIRDGMPLEMRAAGKDVLVTCGTHFLGLIAPVDTGQVRAVEGDPVTSWLPNRQTKQVGPTGDRQVA